MASRIALINNDESVRKMLTAHLQLSGYEAFSYDYAEIDRAVLKQLDPDLIILDFNLQDNGLGWAFLQGLKMETLTAKIPVMITTPEFQLVPEIQSYLLTRYISVVYTPFDPDSLVALVQQNLTLARQAGDIFSSDRLLPILVVDDNEDLCDAMATILKLEGHQVVTAHNGLSALEAVSRVDHCLILLDIGMPVMNGFEFLKAYDQQLRPHTPVIILSAESNLHTRILPSFVVDVLSKPCEISYLLKRIAKYVTPGRATSFIG